MESVENTCDSCRFKLFSHRRTRIFSKCNPRQIRAIKSL